MSCKVPLTQIGSFTPVGHVLVCQKLSIDHREYHLVLPSADGVPSSEVYCRKQQNTSGGTLWSLVARKYSIAWTKFIAMTAMYPLFLDIFGVRFHGDPVGWITR